MNGLSSKHVFGISKDNTKDDRDPVYTSTDSNGSCSKLVRIGLAFTRDHLDPYPYGSVKPTRLGPLLKLTHLDPI